jgi:EmrB/QacA subfamily drug resistance transporter
MADVNTADAGRAGRPVAGAAPSPEHADEGLPARWWILAVLAAVAFMAQLDLFIVNVALPVIGRSYPGASLSGLSWVLNAYAIIFAALLVPAGRLADHFGRRRFLLIGVAVFTLASAGCAAAPDLGVLVAARAVQAAGAALIVPTSLGLLYPAFARRQHATVVGLWAGVGAIAATAGPPVGGLLVGLSWRWIFLINVPIGIATLLGGLRVLPEVRAAPGGRLPDWVSAAGLLAAVTLFVLGTVQGPSWGWTSPKTLLLLAAAALATALTVMRTLRHPHALIERGLFRSRAFTGASIALFVYYTGFAIFLLSVVLFLQDQWHYSVVRSGLAIAPGPATAAVFGISAGRIRARFGRVLPAMAGTLCMAAASGYWLLRTGTAPDYAAAFLPGMLVGGVSAGLTQAPLFAAAGTLPPDRATTGSAVLNMARQVGSAVGVAVVVVIVGSGAARGVADFHHVWIAEAVAGLVACLAVAVTAGPGRASARPPEHPGRRTSSVAGHAVDLLPEDVRVPGVPGMLAEDVHVDKAQ